MLLSVLTRTGAEFRGKDKLAERPLVPFEQIIQIAELVAVPQRDVAEDLQEGFLRRGWFDG